MTLRNKAVPAAYAFLERDGQFLIQRRYKTGYQDGNYQVPAGHVEEGELPSDGIIRELREEVGVTVVPEDVKLVHISYRPKHDETGDRIDFFFLVRKWKGDVRIMEPEKCDDLRWVALDELPDNMSPHVKNAFICMQQGIMYKELDVAYLKMHGLYTL